MIWATRLTTIEDYDEVLEQFSSQWQLLGSPRGMMLLSRKDGSGYVRLYVSVADLRLLKAFPEFELVERIDIPADVTPEQGYADEFAKLFPQSD